MVYTARLEHYISVGKQRLRCGYTTGTCAAAAARGAAELLLTGRVLPAVRVDTPAGIMVEVELLHCAAGPDWAVCAVQKDGGDDSDATDGALIYAKTERRILPGVVLCGGEGVGRITRSGLEQPVGEAAINQVPRAMILAQVNAALIGAGEYCGISVTISVPDGAALAEHTFNPRLGIVGGISILGTSGIVRPMSEVALIDCLKLELDMLRANQVEDVLITPGNYGENFSRDTLGLSLARWATCSNYVGESIDHAAYLGFRSLLLVGHLGKLVKVAGGAMNTHSHVADGRRETICTHVALCGGDQALVKTLFSCVTTDEAVALLETRNLRGAVMHSLAQALETVLCHRAGGGMAIAGVFFSNQYGILGCTADAERLMALHRPRKERETK